MDGALQTQIMFSRTCPIISQVNSLVHACQGNNDEALKIQIECGKAMLGVVEECPIAGYVASAAFAIMGDFNKATLVAVKTTISTAYLASAFLLGPNAGTTAYLEEHLREASGILNTAAKASTQRGFTGNFVTTRELAKMLNFEKKYPTKKDSSKNLRNYSVILQKSVNKPPF